MTDKQKRFCDEYVIDCNATRAYKAAYPTVRSDGAARANGSKLLTKASIRKYIDEKMKLIEDAKIADAKEVMQYLTGVMRGEITEERTLFNELGEPITIEVSTLASRNKAAELLGKRYRLFADKVEVKDEGKERTEKSISSIEAMLEQMVDVNEGDIDA